MSIFKDKTLLITGGTGSFGNAVLKRFLDTDIKEIRIFSRDEKKQEDMRIKYKNDKIKFYIGDVRDFRSIDDAMDGVDYIFHAAALKHNSIYRHIRFMETAATHKGVLYVVHLVVNRCVWLLHFY